jgi:hypothetical protein
VGYAPDNQSNAPFTAPIYSELRVLSTVGQWKQSDLGDSGGGGIDICRGSDTRRTCCSFRFHRSPTLVRWQDLSYTSDQSWPFLQSSIRWCVTSVRLRLHAFTTLAAVTVLIDSYFWDQWPLWPELFSIYFNVYEGKSAEWGVSIFFV